MSELVRSPSFGATLGFVSWIGSSDDDSKLSKPGRVTVATKFSVLLVFSVFVLSVSYLHSCGTIRMFFRDIRLLDDLQYHAGLFFAPRFYDRLTEEALDILQATMENAERKGTNYIEAADICPVILSPIARLDPHWLWLTASLIKPHEREIFKLKVAPVRFITRSATLDNHIRYPFRQDLVKQLQEKGLITLQVVHHESRMPNKELILHRLDDATEQQTEHFILQLFDHASAWESCRLNKCKHCFVLEDDILMSSNWRKRLHEAIEIANAEQPTWGYLKMFEIDDRWKEPKGWTLSFRDICLILVIATVFSIPAFFLIEYEPGLSTRVSIRRLSRVILWMAAAVFLIGKDVLVPSYIISMRSLVDEPTTLHPSKYAERGAVANLYKLDDLGQLAQEAQARVQDALQFATAYFGKNLTKLEPDADRRQHIRFMRHSDRIRADVFAAEFFHSRARGVNIVEPNIVQHIGFRSTEPNVRRIRTAMSPTFEDGRIF